ncbi:hypothetical protein FQN57_005241 [Myotisia sp. PD_48]|nr:hypothetical protein FQN57_005241 [Myotisia sp. PD_48]
MRDNEASTTASFSGSRRPQALPSRQNEDGLFEDIPLAPISSGRRVPSSPQTPIPHPEQAYQSLHRPLNRIHQQPGTVSHSNLRHYSRRSPSYKLWNPVNYVPRPQPTTTQASSSRSNRANDTASRRESYPLLTLLERQRGRFQPNQTSLVIEESADVENSEAVRTSIGLPRGHRRSGAFQRNIGMGEPLERTASQSRDILQSTSGFVSQNEAGPSGNGGGPARPPATLDRTRPVFSQHSHQASTITSLGNLPTASAGADEEAVIYSTDEPAWGPAHPCFPHMNSHVPLNSEEYITTRVIRIRRDWMVRGDLAPTFSNLYPEVLDPLLSEDEFRTVIAKINGELTAAFNPYNLHNWVDGIIGFLTGWIWDDVGAARIKKRLRGLEEWLDEWNNRVGAPEGVKVWGPRRTGFLCLDIQIPDPEVGIAESDATSGLETRPTTASARHEEHHQMTLQLDN